MQRTTASPQVRSKRHRDILSTREQPTSTERRTLTTFWKGVHRRHFTSLLLLLCWRHNEDGSHLCVELSSATYSPSQARHDENKFREAIHDTEHHRLEEPPSSSSPVDEGLPKAGSCKSDPLPEESESTAGSFRASSSSVDRYSSEHDSSESSTVVARPSTVRGVTSLSPHFDMNLREETWTMEKGDQCCLLLPDNQLLIQKKNRWTINEMHWLSGAYHILMYLKTICIHIISYFLHAHLSVKGASQRSQVEWQAKDSDYKLRIS